MREKLWITTTQRNSGSYLAEWLGFHLAAGAGHFLVWDDASDDGTREWLRRLEAAVDWLEVRGTEDLAGEGHDHGTSSFQVRCFSLGAAAALEGGYDWFGGIDIDEFLVARTGRDVVDVLGRVAATTGAVPVSWRTFGSGGQRRREPGWVTERFVECGRSAHRCNHAFKMLCRTGAFRSYYGAHQTRVVDGYAQRWPRGGRVAFANQNRTRSAVHKDLALHHYRVKSVEEYRAKMKLGRRPTGSGEVAGPVWRGYFKEADQCGVVNLEAWRWLAEARVWAGEIEAAAGEFGS